LSGVEKRASPQGEKQRGRVPASVGEFSTGGEGKNLRGGEEKKKLKRKVYQFSRRRVPAERKEKNCYVKKKDVLQSPSRGEVIRLKGKKVKDGQNIILSSGEKGAGQDIVARTEKKDFSNVQGGGGKNFFGRGGLKKKNGEKIAKGKEGKKVLPVSQKKKKTSGENGAARERIRKKSANRGKKEGVQGGGGKPQASLE